jgi:hypothetical protein
MRGIADNKYDIAKYIILNIRIPRKDLKTSLSAKAIIRREAYIINNLQANMLISTDIILPK